jgi:hypothetical protein
VKEPAVEDLPGGERWRTRGRTQVRLQVGVGLEIEDAGCAQQRIEVGDANVLHNGTGRSHGRRDSAHRVADVTVDVAGHVVGEERDARRAHRERGQRIDKGGG